jgi:hypothetical protein
MTSALMDAPAMLFASAGPPGGRRPTLEELLETTRRNARAAGSADCPVCHATMHHTDGTARCDSCGTTLS